MKLCAKYVYWSVLFMFIGMGTVLSNTVEIEENFRMRDSHFTVELDLGGADIKVRPNDRDNVCYVYVAYSKNDCDADIRFDEGRNELMVAIDHGDLGSVLEHGFEDGDYAIVELLLPTRTTIDLNVDSKAGQIDLVFKRLKIKNFRLNNWAGEVTVDFPAPNRTEMETFDVNVKVGEVKLLNLGNAGFKEADINSGIGEMRIDFGGKKLQRCMANIDLDIGETTLVLPRDVGVKMKISKFLFMSSVQYPSWFDQRGRYYYSKNYDDSEDSLYLRVSSGIGELKIELK